MSLAIQREIGRVSGGVITSQKSISLSGDIRTPKLIQVLYECLGEEI